jgi:hypothetical protein
VFATYGFSRAVDLPISFVCHLQESDLHGSCGSDIGEEHVLHHGRMIELLKAIRLTFFLQIAHHLPIQTGQVLKVLRTQMENTAKTMKKRAYKPYRTQANQIMNLLAHCMAFFSSEFSGRCINIITDMYPEVPTNRNFGIVSVSADRSHRLRRKGEENQNDNGKISQKAIKNSESIENSMGRNEHILGLAEK